MEILSARDPSSRGGEGENIKKPAGDRKKEESEPVKISSTFTISPTQKKRMFTCSGGRQ